MRSEVGIRKSELQEDRCQILFLLTNLFNPVNLLNHKPATDSILLRFPLTHVELCALSPLQLFSAFRIQIPLTFSPSNLPTFCSYPSASQPPSLPASYPPTLPPSHHLTFSSSDLLLLSFCFPASQLQPFLPRFI